MAEIRTEEVTYSGGGVEMQGYLAWDDSIEGPRPGILVVHEWWGHNDYPRSRARQLAELGYTALSLDMYGDGKTADHPRDAGAFMNAVIQDMESGRARFEAAQALLKQHPTVNADKIGAIGYCFGGGVVLHMARSGADLDVAASFHGSLGLARTDGPDQIDTRVVAYNGKADPFVTDEAKAAFRAEMESAGADYDLIEFDGAIHGFTNPAATENGKKFDLPLKYDLLADKASWAHLQLVLEAAFGD
ncbi:MAG: dienelactone hydrolase family protein [Xanthomonadales bacterium]|nr:dienelactone hydrolase family protein [Xanthomonadales bacterium]